MITVKFFLDTANLDEIKKAFELGILDGVTTNPALLSKQSGSYKEGVQSIVALTGGAIVFAEVLATEPEGMIREAKEIAAWGPNMVIKLPMTPAGIQACASLTKEGISWRGDPDLFGTSGRGRRQSRSQIHCAFCCPRQ